MSGAALTSGGSYCGGFRAAVIGHTGRGGYSHGLDLCFAGLPGLQVVAVADPDAVGRSAAQQRIGASRAYADYREMLACQRPDVVSVAPSWLDQREAMVLAAVDAGVKAIYCEKPLAQSLDQADRLVAACDALGVKLAVAHQNRGFPAPWIVRHLIRQGTIGRLRAIRAWPKQDERGGGLEFLIHGTHMFDLMRLLAGDARWCHARVCVDGRDANRDDVTEGIYASGPIAGTDVTASYGFDSGVVGLFESMQSDDGGGTQYLRMEVSGTGGTLAFWSSLVTPIYFCPRPFPLPPSGDGTSAGEWRRLSVPVPATPTDVGTQHLGNQTLVQDLLAAVEQDRSPLSSGHDGRASLEMVLAAYASHALGARVRLPMTIRTHPLLGWRASENASAAVE